MDIRKFESQICKTGFALEAQIAQELKAQGWTVISNKYYVDDFEENVREIDLVAYQVTKVQHLDVYTTLIVSCKKSESNTWALLARDINLKDPNSDWWPLHAWSNDKALQHQLNETGKARKYHEDIATMGVTEALAIPEVEVFAFQEMDRKSGSPQNDKPIFMSVTSLMKAQAYELSALPQRKKTPSVYQFNLLSVVEADLVRLKFSGKEIKASPIDTEHYIARYIVKKRESFSRIRFVRADIFSKSLADYGRLHVANCKWFGTAFDSFYDNIVTDWNRVRVLIDDFRREVTWWLNWRIEHELKKPVDLTMLSLDWRKASDSLAVTLPTDNDVLAFLNGDDEARRRTASALKKIFRYSGPFSFDEDDIPF